MSVGKTCSKIVVKKYPNDTINQSELEAEYI